MKSGEIIVDISMGTNHFYLGEIIVAFNTATRKPYRASVFKQENTLVLIEHWSSYSGTVTIDGMSLICGGTGSAIKVVFFYPSNQTVKVTMS